MRKILKIFGVVLLALIIVAFLVGLAIMTIWLFRQGKGSDWSFWIWFSVLFEGVSALIFTPIGIFWTIYAAKKNIRDIQDDY